MLRQRGSWLRWSDVITYEFENIDADVAAKLMTDSYVPQGSKLLYTTQHRIREKRAIEAAGVKVAPYEQIESLAQLQAAIGRFGTPCVLKTATGGYDGKGQWVIRSLDEAEAAFAALEPGKDGACARAVHPLRTRAFGDRGEESARRG